MSEEEQFVISILKNSINTYIEGTKVTKVQLTTKEAEILLNYIDKLKKENETLKEENFDQVYMKAIVDYKDKIRNKIKELEELRDSAITWKLWHRFNSNIHLLEELLGDE